MHEQMLVKKKILTFIVMFLVAFAHGIHAFEKIYVPTGIILSSLLSVTTWRQITRNGYFQLISLNISKVNFY